MHPVNRRQPHPPWPVPPWIRHYSWCQIPLQNFIWIRFTSAEVNSSR